MARGVISLRRLIRAQRSLAMLLLAAALALRALLPAGTMPVANAGQGISVAICDGTGVAGRQTIPIKGTDTSGNEHPCAFSVLAAAFDTGHEVLPPIPAPPVDDLSPPAPRLATIRPADGPLRPPVRGPPSIA